MERCCWCFMWKSASHFPCSAKAYKVPSHRTERSPESLTKWSARRPNPLSVMKYPCRCRAVSKYAKGCCLDLKPDICTSSDVAFTRTASRNVDRLKQGNHVCDRCKRTQTTEEQISKIAFVPPMPPCKWCSAIQTNKGICCKQCKDEIITHHRDVDDLNDEHEAISILSAQLSKKMVISKPDESWTSSGIARRDLHKQCNRIADEKDKEMNLLKQRKAKLESRTLMLQQYRSQLCQRLDLLSKLRSTNLRHLYGSPGADDESKSDEMIGDAMVMLSRNVCSITESVALLNQEIQSQGDVCHYMTKNVGRKRSVLDPDTLKLDIKDMKQKGPKQIRIFVLRENDHLEKKLFRLKQGHVVQFVVSGGLFSRHVRLYCNHPLAGEEFDRHKYNKLKWQNPEGYIHVDFNKYAAVELTQAGTFHYYFTIDNSGEQCGSGYILVDPILRLADESEISLDSLQCQTVLSKCLGPFPEWVDRINVTINSGFNMIHFTPLQELSHQSNSSYAIYDHLKYNPAFGTVSKGYMRKLINSLYEEYNMMSVTDLVYNHVATGCPLLDKHPEVAYNLSNSPHLRPSFLFDRIIHYFSKSVGEGAHDGDGIPSEISSSHLYTIRQYLFHQVLPKYKFDEFVTVDINKAIDEFRCRIKDSKIAKISSNDINASRVGVLQDPKYRRNGCAVDMDAAVKFVNASWDDVSNEEDRIARCCDILQTHLVKLNNERRNKITTDVCAGVDSCISHCRYWFFESGDPNYKRICESTPLAPRYFVYPFDDAACAEEDEKRIYDSEKVAEQCMAYNGWTANNDPLKSFADVGSDVYIRRELIVWNDLVKVRYGDTVKDCPALWEYMERYTIDTVEVFKAVRLDNCHSTPIQVAEYMLDAARKVSPDLYIFGELFTGSEDLDNIFVNRLGITSLVRESMSAYNAYDFGRQIHRYGGQSVGAFYHPPTRPIVSGIAHAIFYDITHDNMCPITIPSPSFALPCS